MPDDDSAQPGAAPPPSRRSRPSLRVLIADDEPVNRERLRIFLAAEPDAVLVAECATGEETLLAIRQSHPDLVLLDVRMPGLDGFDVARSVARHGSRPAIVFVTAYQQFAVRAFGVDAVDYLLKPFDQDRFRLALNRARQRLHAAADSARNPRPPRRSPSGHTAEGAAPSPPLERVAVKAHGRITLVSLAEVDWVAAADNYVELHVGRATHLLRMPLRELLHRAAPGRLVQISRSLLVNVARIQEIRSRPHGDYLVVLHDQTRLLGTRNHRLNLAEKLLFNPPPSR